MTHPFNRPIANVPLPGIPRGMPSERLRLNSQLLFGAQNEIVIEHQGEEYRLRITSNGKLILTK